MNERNTLQQIIDVLVVAIPNGCLFGLIAIGYSMVYSIIGLINFAHGDVFMLGSFFALTLIGLLGISPNLAAGPLIFWTTFLILATSIFCALVNFSVYKLVYQPLKNAPKLILLVSAIGVSLMFQNLGMLWGGIGPEKVMGPPKSHSAPKSFPDLANRTRNILGDEAKTFIGVPQAIVLVVAIPLVLLLNHFVRHTKLGTAMRACEQNPLAAQLMGINPVMVFATTFLIGGFLAGTAAVVSGLYLGTVHFQMGYTTGLYAFTAAVIGGIGSVAGAMLGGLLIGFVKTIVEYDLMHDWFNFSIPAQWVNAVIFTTLILFLIFRPSGILGYKFKEKV